MPAKTHRIGNKMTHTLTTRTVNTLARNGITLDKAEKLSIGDWNILIATTGNGIGAATVLEVQQYFVDIVEEDGIVLNDALKDQYEESKADKKAKEAITVKANDLEQLVTYYINTITPEVVVKRMAAKHKEARNLVLAEDALTKYLLLAVEDRQFIFNKLLFNIYKNTVANGSREILLNKLLGELGGSLQDTMKLLHKGWVIKKTLDKVIGGGINKYRLYANVFMVVLIDVMDLMKLIRPDIHESKKSQHASAVISLIGKEFRLDIEKDKAITKFMMKSSTTIMERYPMKYTRDGRLENGKTAYSGHSLKGAPEQSVTTFKLLNKLQGYTWSIVPQMADKDHNIGKAVRSIIKLHFKDNKASAQELINYLDNYKGEALYSQITITPDNGRMDYRGYPVGLGMGALSWLMEQHTKIYLTAEEAARLQARVDEFGTKGKLSRKDEMEMFHYICALEAYKNGEPTGVVTSNDFKGSGPLVQALLTKNVEGLKMSIEFEGEEAGDPYMKVLCAYAEAEGLQSPEELADRFGVTLKVLRNWCKFHVQPKQYGSGSITSEANGRSEGSKLSQPVFEAAFKVALPHTEEVLEVLKSHAKHLSRSASIMKNVATMHLNYTTAAGINCCITPLSDGKRDGKGFIHSFKILGHNMNVPCKIIDTNNHGVKTIAAGSHQGDSALLWTIYKLFDHQMYTVHDDFRVSVRHEEELQMVAIAVVKMFWEDKQLFHRYIHNVYSCVAEDFAGFGYHCPDVPKLDWTKVTRVLF